MSSVFLDAINQTTALKRLIHARNQEKSPLAKLNLIKQVQELRQKLGLIKMEIKPLRIAENTTSKERYQLAQAWLKENVQGKTITTIDGKQVAFNRNLSVDHLAHNARADQSSIVVKCIPFIVDVFKTGQFIERQTLTKARSDGKVAFHRYEKWVQIDGFDVLLEAKACEYADGRYEALGDVIAYNLKWLKKLKAAHLPSNFSPKMDNAFGGIGRPHTDDYAPFTDDVQAESDYILRIVKIVDPLQLAGGL